jgi:hypothetical protein
MQYFKITSLPFEPKRRKPSTNQWRRRSHMVAASGDLEELKMVAAEDPESLHASDSNGWKPIHEVFRSGRTNIRVSGGRRSRRE